MSSSSVHAVEYLKANVMPTYSSSVHAVEYLKRFAESSMNSSVHAVEYRLPNTSPAKRHVWDGTQWVLIPEYVWNGTNWQQVV